MLLETKNISNQSLMVMLLIVAWLPLPKYNKTEVNSLLNVSTLFLFIFISTFSNIREIKWMWTTWTKRATFIVTKTLYHEAYHYTISEIVHPSLSKDMKGPMQFKRDKCYSLMLLCLKINCINLITKETKPLHHQARLHIVLLQIFLHVILLLSAL